jgi:hypothetical protein
VSLLLLSVLAVEAISAEEVFQKRKLKDLLTNSPEEFPFGEMSASGLFGSLAPSIDPAKRRELSQQAQTEKPQYWRLEPFGGFSLLRLQPGAEDPEGENRHLGWEGGVTVNFLPWLGVTGDLDGFYKNGRRTYHYLVGPRFAKVDGILRFFCHVLVGGVNVSPADLPSERGFAMAVGWGADYGIRFQMDYVMNRVDSLPSKNSLRLLVGVSPPFLPVY